MGTVLKGNELNQFEKGTVLFKKGEQVRFFGMIAKGSIRMEGHGVQRVAKKGMMVGITDLFYNEYLSDYIAEENTVFYAAPAPPLRAPDNTQAFLSRRTTKKHLLDFSPKAAAALYPPHFAFRISPLALHAAFLLIPKAAPAPSNNLQAPVP